MEAEFAKDKNILLAEDEPDVRQAVELLLGLDGHRITQAANGAEALAAFAPGKFDLVITDLRMPVMCGDELARRIKSIDPKQPVMMLTAYAEEIRESKAPIDLIVDKPVRLADLRRAICQVLAHN
ncbi:MAG TPA: response regulator [Clostridia bacterium]|nr:response regulator [Clostridia bacterium]